MTESEEKRGLFSDPIYKKYAGIDLLGRKALKKGDILEWQGFDGEHWKNIYTTVVLFDDESERQVRERVIKELLDIEESLGIKFSLAGRDILMHSTIMSGKFEGEDIISSDLETQEELTEREISELRGLTGIQGFGAESQGVPDSEGSAQTRLLKIYAQKMINLRHEISRNPLTLSFSEVFRGSTHEFASTLRY